MKIYIETLGCAKNASDTETAAGILEAAGHSIVANPQMQAPLWLIPAALLTMQKRNP